MMDAPNFIGNYTIGACLHQGAGADTYLARDLGESREVVIKLAKGSERSREQRHAAFLVEARVAQTVQHPNILAVLDAGVSGAGDDSHPYLIMEHIAGGRTLAEHCDPANLLAVSSAIGPGRPLTITRGASAPPAASAARGRGPTLALTHGGQSSHSKCAAA